MDVACPVLETVTDNPLTRIQVHLGACTAAYVAAPSSRCVSSLGSRVLCQRRYPRRLIHVGTGSDWDLLGRLLRHLDGGEALLLLCTTYLEAWMALFHGLVTDKSRFMSQEKVVGFPFNVTDNPMYYGSTLSFLGTSLWYQSPAGLLLTVVVFVEYKIALRFEE